MDLCRACHPKNCRSKHGPLSYSKCSTCGKDDDCIDCKGADAAREGNVVFSFEREPAALPPATDPRDAEIGALRARVLELEQQLSARTVVTPTEADPFPFVPSSPAQPAVPDMDLHRAIATLVRYGARVLEGPLGSV